MSLDQVADGLAEQVRRRWERAANERRLLYQAPIPVRWQRSRQPVAGPVDEAVGGEPGTGRFRPLPGIGRVDADALNGGGLSDLLAVYGGLGSGRMLLLGGLGAGKSGAVIRLLLYALQHGAGLSDDERKRVPVPVLFTLHGWDPVTQPLASWLAERLAGDHPLLGRREHAQQVANRLVEDGRVG